MQSLLALHRNCYYSIFVECKYHEGVDLGMIYAVLIKTANKMGMGLDGFSRFEREEWHNLPECPTKYVLM